MVVAAVLGCVAYWHAVGFAWWESVLMAALTVFAAEFWRAWISQNGQ